MNTEDYVTYEQAVKLKELEFSGEATGKYVDCPKDPTLFHGMLYQSWNLEKDEILAPTLSQAAKWLREKGLFINVFSADYNDKNEKPLYGWLIEELGNPNEFTRIIARYNKVNGRCINGAGIDSYEKALSNAIDKALEILE